MLDSSSRLYTNSLISDGLGNALSSTNVNGTTRSLNVFIENANNGSLLGRVNLYDSTDTYPVTIEANGDLSTRISDGINTANVVSSTASSTGLSGNAILNAPTGYTFTYSITSNSNTTAIDLINYPSMTIQCTAAGSGATVALQGSEDNSTWSSVFMLNRVSSGQGAGTASLSGTGGWQSKRQARYFRLSTTGYTSGTYTVVVTVYTSSEPDFFQVTSSQQAGTWNIGSSSTTGSAIPANAFYMGTTNTSGNLTGLKDASVGSGQTSGILATQLFGWNGNSSDLTRSGGDNTDTVATTTYGSMNVSGRHMIYNGTTFERARDATAASGTTGTGILAAGAMGIYNSTAPTGVSGDYYQLQLDSSANLKVNVAAGIVTDNLSADAAFTITLASLATSATGVGQQSTLISNASGSYSSAMIYVQVEVGTSPTANTPIYVYLIRDNGDATTHIVDDGAGATNAGITIVNAPLLGVLTCPATTTNAVYQACFDTSILGPLGPKWGIAIVNSTGAALASSGSAATYVGVTKAL
jgi:hypothetical protein